MEDHSRHLVRALAFDRAVRVRGAQRATELPGGIAVRHDGLRNKYILNAVMLDRPLPACLDAPALTRLADEQLNGLGHRYVVLDDAPAGERVAPVLRAAGWSVQWVLYMRLARDPDRPPRAGVARRIDEATLRQAQLAMAFDERGGEGSVERSLTETLVAGEAALRSGTLAVGFGAGEDGDVAASATLFLEREEGNGGTAMIDEVGTLIAARGRGLARAVVAAAADAARASGCDPIIIPADAGDWPRLLYERMGFEPLGMQVAFTLPNPP